MERAITKIVGLFDRMPEVCMDPAVVHNDRDVVLINKSPKLTATQGIPQPDLESELADVSTKTRMDAINRLLKEQKIEVGRNANKDLIYRQVEAGKSARMRGLTAEDKLVYQCIEQAGNTGLWTKDMKFKTNLQQPQITKILKVLESRSLVKAIKPVSQPSKKFYMLFDLEPAREITGGAWYTDQDYDATFVDVLRKQCYSFIKQEGDPTLNDVSEHIHKEGISRVNLRDEDVMMILSTLEYDGQIERVAAEDGERFRQALLAIPDTSAFTSVPCGVCPVFRECTPDGPISPATCIYYQQWLDY